MGPLKPLLGVLIAAALTGLPVSEAAEPPEYPVLTSLSLTLGGMALGVPMGAVAWGRLAEPLIGCDNDIECGMGPVVRIVLLGVPAGMVVGGAVGAGLAHGAVLHTDPNRFWPVIGGLAGLSTALIVTTPFLHQSLGLYGAGLVLGLVGVPVASAALAARAARRERARPEGIQVVGLGPIAVADGGGMIVSLAW